MPAEGNTLQEPGSSKGSSCLVNDKAATGMFGRWPTSVMVPCGGKSSQLLLAIQLASAMQVPDGRNQACDKQFPGHFSAGATAKLPCLKSAHVLQRVNAPQMIEKNTGGSCSVVSG